MKLIPVTYFGFTAMDRRFSSPMLPWVVSEIRKRDYSEKLSVGIEDGILQAYNPDFELQFSHKVWQVTRFSQADQDPTTFLYLLRDDGDTLLYCYLFQAKKSIDVLHVIDQVLDPMIKTPQSHPPTAYDFLQHYNQWKISGERVENFRNKIHFYHMQKEFQRDGGHTFFIPIDEKMDDYKLQSIDPTIIRGHIIPNQVLFTRPAMKNFIYETAAIDDDNHPDIVYIVVSLQDTHNKTYVKSYTVLGDSQHKKGETTVEIVKANIPVTNGVVHLISQPLAVFERQMKLFPYLSTWYKINADPDLSKTHRIGVLSRIDDLLKKKSAVFTYFAPIDRAWKKFANQTDEELGDMLQRHLIQSDTLFTMEKLRVMAQNNTVVLNSLQGPIRLGLLEIDGEFWLKWRGKPIRVYRADYECDDGIVHMVDGIFGDVQSSFSTETTETKTTGFWGALKTTFT